MAKATQKPETLYGEKSGKMARTAVKNGLISVRNFFKMNRMITMSTPVSP